MYAQGNFYLDGYTLKAIAFLIRTCRTHTVPAGKGVLKKQQGIVQKAEVMSEQGKWKGPVTLADKCEHAINRPRNILRNNLKGNTNL